MTEVESCDKHKSHPTETIPLPSPTDSVVKEKIQNNIKAWREQANRWDGPGLTEDEENAYYVGFAECLEWLHERNRHLGVTLTTEAPETAIEFGMDAKKWTDEFLKLKPDATDFGVMIGWFSNAIMAGYDRANWANEKRIAELEAELDAALAGASIEAKRADDLQTKLFATHSMLVSTGDLQAKIKELTAENERLKIEINEYQALKQEKDRVAKGKLTCADCDSILARW